MSESLTQRKLPRGIWALGFVSLFMDMSSETIHGLLPVFLVSVLGASVTLVGVFEGVAEGTALVVKVFSGPLSDYLGRRKALVFIGYAMGALSKPIFALSNSMRMVFGARLFDRIGKGIRGAPRDAMVADLAPPELRGRAFGLRQTLDTVGAFLGPLLAIVLMQLTGGNYRLIFWLAAIPGLVSVAVLLFGVREQKVQTKAPSRQRIRLFDIREFQLSFWFISGAGALFQLARFSEAFLILRAKDIGLGIAIGPLVLIVMNAVYALSAYPIGYMSDRIRREWFLLGGLLVLCLSDLVLALGSSPFSILSGVALWGLHLGLTQGTLAALVADTCPPERRGTAYGFFNLMSAGALLLASIIAGVLWDQLGPQVTFFVGSGFSLLSFIAFFMTRTFWSQRK